MWDFMGGCEKCMGVFVGMGTEEFFEEGFNGVHDYFFLEKRRIPIRRIGRINGSGIVFIFCDSFLSWGRVNGNASTTLTLLHTLGIIIAL